MYILDILIAAPILYFFYRGAVNGLVKEILNIVGIVLAVFLTFNYMDAFSGIISPMFENNPALIPFASGATLFLGTLIIIGLIALGTKKMLEAANLGTVNRVLGGIFGGLKAGIMVSTILLLLAGFNFPAEKSRDESFLYEYVLYLGPWSYNAVATIFPGAKNYTETIEKNMSKYNPTEKILIPNDN